MEKTKKSKSSVVVFINPSIIRSYDKLIKKTGMLSRCEERIIFEKIVKIQNDIIKDLLTNEHIFKIFNNIVYNILETGEYLNLVHFDTNEFKEMGIEEIYDSYKVFFDMCYEATNFNEMLGFIHLVKFNNELFEELLGHSPDDLIKKFHIDHRIKVIENHRINIYEHNIALVINHALNGQYNCQNLTIEDIIQEGMLGLKKAIIKYNPLFRTKFSTHATQWIHAEITRAIDIKERLIAIPCNVISSYNKSIKKLNRLVNSEAVSTNTNEIVNKLNDSSFYYIESVRLNLDAKVNSDQYSIHEIVADPNIIKFDIDMEITEIKNNILHTVNSLPNVEKYIVCSLYGLTEDHKLMNNKEIMEKLNINAYEYNILKNSAFNSLRDEFETNPLFNNWQQVLQEV